MCIRIVHFSKCCRRQQFGFLLEIHTPYCIYDWNYVKETCYLPPASVWSGCTCARFANSTGMFQRYNQKYSTSFVRIPCSLVCHINTSVPLKQKCLLMHAYIIFLTLLPTLSLCPFEISSLCSGNPIPVNHRVINDHFFPTEYGWLRLTLQLNLAQTDRDSRPTNCHCLEPAL